MFRTIGPVWDGNEVWLVIAGAAMFAAFPTWYATMFSGFYIALLLLLVFLIVRVLSFEWRERHEHSRLARLLGLGEHDRQPRRRPDLGCRVLESALRRADQLQRRLRRHLLGPLQPVHAARRGRGRAAVRVPRRDLPDAAHDRRAVPARRGGRRPALDRDGRRRRGVPDLDRRGRGRPQRQGRLPAAAARAARDRRTARRRRLRPARPQRLGVRAHRGRRLLRRGHDLHEPLPPRHGRQQRLRQQPHRRQRLLGALHAQGDERRGADRRADHPALPGLDVPRLPRRGWVARRIRRRPISFHDRPAPRSADERARPAPRPPRGRRARRCSRSMPRSASSPRSSSSPRPS